MTADIEELRLAVYRGFATTGRAPEPAELPGGPDEVRRGLRALHDQRHLVLDESGRIIMAHPFSAVPLGFAVMGSRTLWWGGCAWDSFALPHLVPGEPEVLVSTRCPGCGRPHAWSVGRDGPPPGGQIAHFPFPVARMWDDVVRTCGDQRIFCGEECLRRGAGLERGYVMDLPTLWRFARGWYAGRLDRGYVRREPDQAADYFRSVGLSGPFWGI